MSTLSMLPIPPPNLAETSKIYKTAATGNATELAADLRQKARESLYFFTKTILNFNALSPNFHYDRCQEIQDSIRFLKRGFLWPRGHFKSTIMKAYVLWRLCGGGNAEADFNDPLHDPRNMRFLFIGESGGRVVAALRNIKWHLTQNNMMRWLFPEVCPIDTNKVIWCDDEICLPRSIDYDESTIRVIGVGTKITGFHGNTFVFDDLVGEKAAGSEAVMLTANEMVDYAIGLADKPDEVELLFVGTRWKFGKADTYGKLMDEQPFYEDAQGLPHGIKWYVHSALLEDGTPAFPERFSISALEDIHTHLKDYKYSCQYLNTPSSPEGGDFPSVLVKSFLGTGSTITPSDGTPPCQLNDLLRISFYDLSSGGSSKDVCENAIVILGTHPDGRRFVLDAFLKNCGYRAALEAWYRLNDQYCCYQNWYEMIGAQKEIEEFDVLVRANGCELCRRKKEIDPALEVKPHKKLRMRGYNHKGFGGNKEDRMRLYLQSTVEEGRLYINAKLAALRVQVVSFPHYHLRDGADALASAVHLSRAPIGESEQQSRDIETEQKQAPPEPRVHSSRVYGGYA